MRLNYLILAALILPVSVAHSAITASWQRSNPSPAAIADDPVLATMQSWLLRVTHTDGDWDEAGLQVQLTGGSFYNNPLGGNTPASPAVISAFPAVGYDTYVTSPADDNGTNNATNVLSGFPTGSATMNGNLFSVTWGDLLVRPPGTYTIARLTFPLSLDTNAEVNVIQTGDLPPPHQNAWSYTSQVNPDRFALIHEIPFDIPEPVSIGLLAGFGVMMRRQRAYCRRPPT